MKPFSTRIGNVMARTCDLTYQQTGDHETAEVIMISDDGNQAQSLAQWKKDHGGYYLEFVGGRPFQVDSGEFMYVSAQCQAYLMNHYQATQPQAAAPGAAPSKAG